MTGALEDFARRPLGVKIGTFAGLGALLGLLYFQFGYQAVKKEIEQAEGELEADKADARKLKAQKDEYDQLILRQDEIKKRMGQSQKALPTEAEMPAFFDLLARRTAEAGVEPIKRSVGKEIALDAVVKVPVDIEVTGTFYQLKRFFVSLRVDADQGNGAPAPGEVAEKNRLVTIENLSISDPKVKNGAIVLTAKFVAATFRAGAAATAPAPPGAVAPKPAAAPPPPAAPGVTKDPKQLGARAETGAAAGDARAKKASGTAEGSP